MTNLLRSIVLVTSIIAISCSSSGEGTRTGAESEDAQQSKPVADEGFIPYQQAVAKAKSENKLIMIDMYTTWCGWCKRMDRDVFPNEQVRAEMGKYFKAVKMNAESTTVLTFDGKLLSEQQVAKALGVRSFPTTIFLSADEKIVHKLPGYLAPQEFALVLRFIGTGAHRTSKYDEWKKTQTL